MTPRRSAAQKRATAPRAEATIPDADVGLLTHAARMLAVLDRDSEHVRRREYDRQLAVYGQRWTSFSDEYRTAIIAAARTVDHLDVAFIDSAVAALEG